MRIARVAVAAETRTAILDADGEHARVLPRGVDMSDLLSSDDRDALLAGGEARRLSDLALLAPVDPPAIRDFSVFEQHIEGIMLGQGNPVPANWYDSPFCYFSNPGAVTGPGQDIAVPPGCRALDLELEVAVIVGRAGRNLTPAEAGGYIAGYTIFNDWSARDLQIAEMALGLGICKGKDFANTLGPWIVTPDELEPYRSGDRLDLGLKAEINGQALRDGDTLANMAWSFEELVSYASRGTWIRPGDVIGSGTCGSGCLIEVRGRYGEDDHPWLVPGDEITLNVEGIGALRNRVVAGVDPVPLPPARPGRLRQRAAL